MIPSIHDPQHDLYYSGIGAVETPPDVLELMTQIADALASLGWILRSGGAPGADTAFERGAVGDRRWSRIELYLPWPGFKGRIWGIERERATDAAFELAAKHHPVWDRLGRRARELLARDVHQVLGADLCTPSKFVLCWTPDGATTRTTSRTGGTGQAIRVAAAYGVPVYNLQRSDHHALWSNFVERMQ